MRDKGSHPDSGLVNAWVEYGNQVHVRRTGSFLMKEI